MFNGGFRLEYNELPLKDRYDRLLDDLALSVVLSYAHAKELGTIDKLNDLHVMAMKKMLPGYLGISLKLMKMIAPNKTFKKIFQNFINTYLQTFHSLSNIKVSWLSDREVNVVINCDFIKKMKDVVDKTGLAIDPRIWCKSETYIFKEFMKDFGLDVTLTPNKNGCKTNVKLK